MSCVGFKPDTATLFPSKSNLILFFNPGQLDNFQDTIMLVKMYPGTGLDIKIVQCIYTMIHCVKEGQWKILNSGYEHRFGNEKVALKTRNTEALLQGHVHSVDRTTHFTKYSKIAACLHAMHNLSTLKKRKSNSN